MPRLQRGRKLGEADLVVAQEHEQVVEEICRFLEDLRPVAAHGGQRKLDAFFADFLVQRAAFLPRSGWLCNYPSIRRARGRL